MAVCKLTPQEFIKEAFTPQVAALCSPLAEQTCGKNNLSFVELLQPFCKLNVDVCLLDTTIHNLKIKVMDVNFRPPQPTLARKFLNASVSAASETRTQTTHDLETPVATPWFETWRETFLQVQHPSDHEFTKHFLACILVVSSKDNNPIETMNHLNQTLNHIQNMAPNRLPKWFCSNILRYYVLVHDNYEDESSIIVPWFESMGVLYETNNCFVLRINSRQPGQVGEQLPDPWSQYVASNLSDVGGDGDSNLKTADLSPNAVPLMSQSLEIGQELGEDTNSLIYHPLSPDTEELDINEDVVDKRKSSQDHSTVHGLCLSTEDVEQIKTLIHKFCTNALLPYLEKQIQQLSDSVSNKKGVSKSLFSATKRWFAPNKAGATNIAVNMLMYPPDAPELQMRRLADLYFMFGHYSSAYQAYHAAKRDFNADQAWLYYAGALEMAGLAAFMANESSKKTSDYLEEAITTYLTTCKMAQFATRATLLSCECLKGRSLYGEAAHQLIRMTSEESDLRSALLLEQAAYCFLNCSRPYMVRKYAFHMVLSGHRFSKAAQRKHALRCYKQALQVYKGKGWNIAEDHIHYTIGKLSTGLNSLEEAAESFSMLLNVQSKQSVQQQLIFLKEYLSVQNMILKSQPTPSLLILPLPQVSSGALKVLVGPTPPLSIPGKVPALGVSFNTSYDTSATKKWNKLEEMLVGEAQNTQSIIFKPVINLYGSDNLGESTVVAAIVNEPIQTSLELCNPLAVALNLKDIYLCWSFEEPDGTVTTNGSGDSASNLESSKCLKTHLLKSLVLDACNKQVIVLSITPLVIGQVFLTGVIYTLQIPTETDNETCITGRQPFDLTELKLLKCDARKANDGIRIDVMPYAPCLQVVFSETCKEVIADELQKVTMELRNVGRMPLHNIHLASSSPHLLSFCEFTNNKGEFVEVDGLETPAVRDRDARRNHVTKVPLPNHHLDAGQCHTVTMWLKAPESKGPALVDLIVYYENTNPSSIPRYRVIKHMWDFKVYDSLTVTAVPQQSFNEAKEEEMVISVNIVNSNKFHYAILTSFYIFEVALLSTSWELSPNFIAADKIVLQPEMFTHVVLKAKRRASTTTRTSHYNQVPLVSQTRRQQPGQVHLDFTKRKSECRVNIFEETVPKTSIQEGVLVVQWEAAVSSNPTNKRYAVGQSYVVLEKPVGEDDRLSDYEGNVVLYDPGHSVEMPSSRLKEEGSLQVLQKQMAYNILFPGKIEHNFSENKICVVPVTLLLHNVTDTHVIVTVNTLGTNGGSPAPSSRSNLFYPFSSKNFRWIGLSKTTTALQGFSSTTVSLLVAVLSDGTYDLGSRLEIWCQNSNDPEDSVLQASQIQSALIVYSRD